MSKSTEEKAFWSKFFKSVGAETRDLESVIGTSGIVHSFSAVGVDDIGKRLILVSGENDAKAAALSQIDIQLTMPDVRICLIRPVVISLPQIASALMDVLGTTRLYMEQIQSISETKIQESIREKGVEFLEKNFGTIGKKFDSIPLSIIGQIQFVMKQIISQEMVDAFKKINFEENASNPKPYFNLSSFDKVDILKDDRTLGICGLPLYESSDNDVQLIIDGHVDDIRSFLKDRDVYQFFPPPPADTTMLGLIENSRINKENIQKQVNILPQIGHPFGEQEITTKSVDAFRIVTELRNDGYIVEGELNMTLSEKGEAVRAKIKFKPREGVISKLINKLRISVGIHF